MVPFSRRFEFAERDNFSCANFVKHEYCHRRVGSTLAFGSSRSRSSHEEESCRGVVEEGPCASCEPWQCQRPALASDLILWYIGGPGKAKPHGRGKTQSGRSIGSSPAARTYHSLTPAKQSPVVTCTDVELRRQRLTSAQKHSPLLVAGYWCN
jgi:hypothetical protein